MLEYIWDDMMIWDMNYKAWILSGIHDQVNAILGEDTSTSCCQFGMSHVFKKEIRPAIMLS